VFELFIVKRLTAWRWPSTAETCSHRQTNKSRSYDNFVLTDPPTLICIFCRWSAGRKEWRATHGQFCAAIRLVTLKKVPQTSVERPIEWRRGDRIGSGVR
jgi:hypothetical protein